MRSQLINNIMNKDDMLLFEAYELSKVDAILENILPGYGDYIITEKKFKLPSNAMTKKEFESSSQHPGNAPWDSKSTNTMDYNADNPLDGKPTMTAHPEGLAGGGSFFPDDPLGLKAAKEGFDGMMENLEGLLEKVLEYGAVIMKAVPVGIATGIASKLLGKGIKFLLRDHDPEARAEKKRDERSLRITHAMQQGENMSDDELDRLIDKISDKLDVKYGKGVSWWKEMLWRVSDFFDQGAGKYVAGLGALVFMLV